MKAEEIFEELGYTARRKEMIRTDQFERSETPAEIKLKNTEYGRDTEITIVKRSGVIILRSFDNEVVFGLDSLKVINEEIEKIGWLV